MKSSRRLLAAGWLLAAMLSGCGAPSSRAPHRVAPGSALTQLLGGVAPAWLPGDSATRVQVWQEMAVAYPRETPRPLWLDGVHARPAALELARVLEAAPSAGLDPGAYGTSAIRAVLDTLASFAGADTLPPELAELDMRLTAAFLVYARDAHAGRFPAHALDPDWAALRDTLDGLALLRQAAPAGHPEERLASAEPTSERYRALRGALARHTRIASAGGWPAVTTGVPLAPGADDPRCAELRERLRATGDLADTSHATRFDDALVGGLRRFQRRHGLAETGALDAPTQEALAVPLAERIRTLAMNLERARWVTLPLPEPHIEVNLPEFRLRLVNGGRDSLTMRVVVGQPNNPSPVFSDVMRYIEFNPVWRLPKRIVVEEVLPGYRRQHDYFVKHQMRVLDTQHRGLPEVNPASVPWDSIGSDRFGFLVQQDAGPANPLGQIKFMMPNEYDVYLHDTSARGFFRRDARALSHGCVRVQNPVALAEYVLRGRPEDSRDSIRAIVDARTSRRVPLVHTLPVHLQYWTAWVDSAGDLNFRPDLYRLDARMAAAIEAGTESRFELNPAIEWKSKVSGVTSRIAYVADTTWKPAPHFGADSTKADSVRR